MFNKLNLFIKLIFWGGEGNHINVQYKQVVAESQTITFKLKCYEP